MMTEPNRLMLVATALVGLLGSGCQDTCDEARVALGIDEPGPSGESPLDTFGFTEGTRVGTLTLGSTKLFEVEVVTTLASSATMIEREHSGPGRLMCIDSVEIGASIQIKTTTGTLLDDTFDVWLAVPDSDAGLMASIESRSDISDHEFEDLGFEPASAPHELGLDLRLVWLNDAAGTMRGWITLGDDEFIQFEVVAQ